ncbi:U8-theraphotoxin-Hhn1c 3-like [Argiope bruennichi]|uniref:Prokineticin domain-containing protein n=1 Tax=Argiope bruennichi TaxID=94029 RepID=A0A8T0FT37_ARGBR|nr:U8-theraphotoxin-Hhn1c 3-like [Argiope bruennichi]KAF8792680.1 hypothetical protein HNY73_004250 [Argiope bruennichi]
MSTKMVLGFLLLLFVIGYVSACNSQADCPNTHCCAKKAFVEGEFNCVPYRQKYELCLDGGLDEILYDGKYDITCPCKPGLMCLKFEHGDGRMGFTAYGNPTCRNVTEDRILLRQQNQYRYMYNSITSGNAYAYARSRK